MSEKCDHKKAKENAEWILTGFDPGLTYDLAKAYLDLVKQHEERAKKLEWPSEEELDELATDGLLKFDKYGYGYAPNGKEITQVLTKFSDCYKIGFKAALALMKGEAE